MGSPLEMQQHILGRRGSTDAWPAYRVPPSHHAYVPGNRVRSFL